jgi:hypothetical protein
MTSMVTRLALLAGLVVLVQVGFSVVRAGSQPPHTKLPSRSVNELPLQWPAWQGREVELDRKIFIATGAKETANREYVNRSGRHASVHVALFENPTEGLYHSPGNCYRATGWTQTENRWITLQTKGRPDVTVNLSRWELKGEPIYVLYWFELGDDSLFERRDLLPVRWKMRGRSEWPPLFKVLMQTSAADKDMAVTELSELAGEVRDWLGTLAEPSTPGNK